MGNSYNRVADEGHFYHHVSAVNASTTTTEPDCLMESANSSGNVSLPLSDSIVPDTFDVDAASKNREQVIQCSHSRDAISAIADVHGETVDCISSIDDMVGPQKPPVRRALPPITSYAQATNLAIEHPELASYILSQPLSTTIPPPLPPTSTTESQFNKKAGVGFKADQQEHTPSRPNWALATDIPSQWSDKAVVGKAVVQQEHTPSRPNWAVAADVPSKRKSTSNWAAVDEFHPLVCAEAGSTAIRLAPKSALTKADWANAPDFHPRKHITAQHHLKPTSIGPALQSDSQPTWAAAPDPHESHRLGVSCHGQGRGQLAAPGHTPHQEREGKRGRDIGGRQFSNRRMNYDQRTQENFWDSYDSKSRAAASPFNIHSRGALRLQPDDHCSSSLQNQTYPESASPPDPSAEAHSVAQNAPDWNVRSMDTVARVPSHSVPICDPRSQPNIPPKSDVFYNSQDPSSWVDTHQSKPWLAEQELHQLSVEYNHPFFLHGLDVQMPPSFIGHLPTPNSHSELASGQSIISERAKQTDRRPSAPSKGETWRESPAANLRARSWATKNHLLLGSQVRQSHVLAPSTTFDTSLLDSFDIQSTPARHASPSSTIKASASETRPQSQSPTAVDQSEPSEMKRGCTDSYVTYGTRHDHSKTPHPVPASLSLVEPIAAPSNFKPLSTFKLGGFAVPDDGWIIPTQPLHEVPTSTVGNAPIQLPVRHMFDRADTWNIATPFLDQPFGQMETECQQSLQSLSMIETELKNMKEGVRTPFSLSAEHQQAVDTSRIDLADIPPPAADTLVEQTTWRGGASERRQGFSHQSQASKYVPLPSNETLVGSTPLGPSLQTGAVAQNALVHKPYLATWQDNKHTHSHHRIRTISQNEVAAAARVGDLVDKENSAGSGCPTGGRDSPSFDISSLNALLESPRLFSR